MSLLVEIACVSCCGKVRKTNEDNLLFQGRILENTGGDLWPPQGCSLTLKETPELIAVFDGMGGEANGEEASFTAAKKLREIWQNKPLNAQMMFPVARKMNEAVFRRGQELMTERMGTTMAVMTIGKTETVVSNLGDSPIFVMRNGKLHKVSKDHTDAEEMKRRGITNRKPYLTQYLGIDPEELTIEPYVARIQTTSGDRYLLCSDGLTDMVEEPEIVRILGGAASASDAVEALTIAALENGGRDNVTIIAAFVRQRKENEECSL